jgi:hypothetical protein
MIEQQPADQQACDALERAIRRRDEGEQTPASEYEWELRRDQLIKGDFEMPRRPGRPRKKRVQRI